MERKLDLTKGASIILGFTSEDIEYISSKFEINTKQDLLDAINEMIAAYMNL